MRNDTLSSWSSSAGIADHAMAVVVGLDDRRQRPDVPARDPGALGERQRVGDGLACRGGEAGADRRQIGVGIVGAAVLVDDEHVDPQVRRNGRRVEVVAAHAHAADLGDRRGEGIDEAAARAARGAAPRRPRAVSASGISARRMSFGSVRTSAWTSSPR